MEFVSQHLSDLLLVAALLGAGIYSLFGFYRIEYEDGESVVKYNTKHLRRTVIGAVAAVVVVSTLAFVPAGHRGVVFDQGQGVEGLERGEGINLVIPFWQRVKNVNVRTQVFEYESFVQTKDLQEVTLPLAINFHVSPDAAAQLYQEVGYDYVKTIIEPAAFQASTQAAGQIEASNIAENRAALATAMADVLVPKLLAHGINVEFVSVKDAVFDPQFIEQIKNNVISEKKKIESKNLVTVALNDANAAVESARGEAEAERVKGQGTAEANEAINATLNDKIIEWKRLTQWNGQLPTTLLGDSQSPIINLP